MNHKHTGFKVLGLGLIQVGLTARVTNGGYSRGHRPGRGAPGVCVCVCLCVCLCVVTDLGAEPLDVLVVLLLEGRQLRACPPTGCRVLCVGCRV